MQAREVADRRGRSRSVSPTFCKQCGTFIDEVPGKSHAERRAAAAKVLDATSTALDVICAMTSTEAFRSGRSYPKCIDRVLQAIQDEDRVDDIILHDHLREAIVKTMEDPDSPWSEVTTRGTSPTPVAMMVSDTTGMPYSKATAKMYGKGPRADIWPPGHPEATDAQASQGSHPTRKGKGNGKDPAARLSLLIAH